jgi:hypothetical protein
MTIPTSQTNQIVERIAQIQVLIEVSDALRPNVILVEPYQPSDTNSAVCPFFINEIHGGPSNLPISSGQQYIEEDIWMVLCVRRKEANTNLKLTLQETVNWRDAVYAAFANRVKLSNPADDNTPGQSHVGLPFVVDGSITSWDAIDYIYGTNEYLALKFVLHCNEMFVTTIAP